MVQRQPLTKDMLIQDAVDQYPEIVSVFLEYGLACVGCYIAGSETIEQGARGHGMSDQEIANMLLDALERIEQKDEPKAQTSESSS